MSINCKLVILILALTLDGQESCFNFSPKSCTEDGIKLLYKVFSSTPQGFSVGLIDQAVFHTGNIYGGHEAKPHSRPYMVLLEMQMQDGKTKHCGAFLLNEDFVMTAAHCQAKTYNALLAVHNAQKPTNIQNISVEQTFPHGDYDANDYRNDIMLLKLSSKAHYNKNVQPIHLADRVDGSQPKSCTVAGWGRTEKSRNYMSVVLMEVNVTLVDDEQCPKEKSFCSKGKIGPRQGDSGGPLVCEDGKAFGVVSSGSSPDSDGSQICTYAKIPDYREWIDSVITKARKLKFL